MSGGLGSGTKSVAAGKNPTLCLIILLSLLSCGCAAYDTPDQRMKDEINRAKFNYQTCTAAYKGDPKLKAFADLLLTQSISSSMTRDERKPSGVERQQIRSLASKELKCRKSMIYGAAKAIDANYAVRSSPAVVNMLKSLATGYVKDTEELFGDLHSGNFTYGDFYSEMKDLYARQDRSLALHSALGHAEDLISYQQRRAAVDRAMANVRKGMEESCIGCAFSKEDRTGSKGIAVSQKSHGILQSQKISGVNKICEYTQSGSANYVTVKAYEACPASGSRVPPSGNGIFKSSYNNGLNKACVYDQLGSKNVITVGLSESCPR